MKKLIASIAILGVIAGIGINYQNVINNAEVEPPTASPVKVAGEEPPIFPSPKVAIWLPDVPPAEINIG